MSTNLTNSEKLIIGRQAIDSYLKEYSLKNYKSPSSINLLTATLEEIGFSYDEFLEFNIEMNLIEADQCYRFRQVNDPSKPALCDNCEGRCNTTCYDLSCSTNYVYNKYTPNSNIMQEQIDEANRLGLSNVYICPPVCFFITYPFGFTMPGYCTGKSHKIKDPQFDLSWGMEQFFKLGQVLYQKMKDA